VGHHGAEISSSFICIKFSSFAPEGLTSTLFQNGCLAFRTQTVFRFSRYSLRADLTENIVPLLTWMMWYHVFQCSGTIRLAPDRVATLLPEAYLLLAYYKPHSAIADLHTFQFTTAHAVGFSVSTSRC
jgi:hypothetical protein